MSIVVSKIKADIEYTDPNTIPDIDQLTTSADGNTVNVRYRVYWKWTWEIDLEVLGEYLPDSDGSGVLSLAVVPSANGCATPLHVPSLTGVVHGSLNLKIPVPGGGLWQVSYAEAIYDITKNLTKTYIRITGTWDNWCFFGFETVTYEK